MATDKQASRQAGRQARRHAGTQAGNGNTSPLVPSDIGPRLGGGKVVKPTLKPTPLEHMSTSAATHIDDSSDEGNIEDGTTEHRPPEDVVPMSWPRRVKRQRSVIMLELFSPPRVTLKFIDIARAASPQVSSKGLALDLKAGWDAGEMADRRALMEFYNTQRSEVLVASPPCTQFSILQNLNKRKRTPEYVIAA